MRHNPASGAIIVMLRSLKMHGMAQAVGELAEQGSPAFEAAVPILSQLLKAETAELVRLVSRFRTASGETVPRPRPQPADRYSPATASPARAMARRVATTFGATAPQGGDDDGWSEF